MFKQSGISLTEIIIVISIMVILLSTVTPAYNYYQVSTRLNENTAQLVQALRLAQERSLAGLNNSAHGVFLQVNSGDDQYIIYQGSSYATRDPAYDRVQSLGHNLDLSFSELTLSNDDVDLNFSSGLGRPSDAGNIILTSRSRSKTISINSLGLVQSN